MLNRFFKGNAGPDSNGEAVTIQNENLRRKEVARLYADLLVPGDKRADAKRVAEETAYEHTLLDVFADQDLQRDVSMLGSMYAEHKGISHEEAQFGRVAGREALELITTVDEDLGDPGKALELYSHVQYSEDHPFDTLVIPAGAIPRSSFKSFLIKHVYEGDKALFDERYLQNLKDLAEKKPESKPDNHKDDYMDRLVNM